MSYEGYSQNLCKNGHLWHDDATYIFLETEPKHCPICGQSAVVSNEVDETNNESVGYIDMNQFLLVPQTMETCNLGHKHMTKPAIYRIPTKEEVKKLRNKSQYEEDLETIEARK